MGLRVRACDGILGAVAIWSVLINKEKSVKV